MKKGQVYSINSVLLICFYLKCIYEGRGLLIGFLCEKGKDKFHKEKPPGFGGFWVTKKLYRVNDFHNFFVTNGSRQMAFKVIYFPNYNDIINIFHDIKVDIVFGIDFYGSIILFKI